MVARWASNTAGQAMDYLTQGPILAFDALAGLGDALRLIVFFDAYVSFATRYSAAGVGMRVCWSLSLHGSKCH